MILFAAAWAWLACAVGDVAGLPLWLVTPAAVAVAAVAPALSRRQRLIHAGLGTLVAVAALFALRPASSATPANSIAGVAGAHLRLLLTVDSPPDPHPSYVALNARVDAVDRDGAWQPASGRVRLLLAAGSSAASGDELEVFGAVEPASALSSAGYGAWLARQGIAGTVAFPRVLEDVPGSPSPLGSAWDSLRRDLIAGLQRALPQNEALLGAALLFGGRHALPAGLATDLQDSGLSHIAAVSSFKLVLLFGVVTALLAPVAGRRRAALAGCTLALLYGLLGGSGVSGVRGEVVVAFSALAIVTGRPGDGVRSLVLAGALLSLFDVRTLSDPSFQLSFAAAAGELLLAPWLNGLLNRRLQDDARRGPVAGAAVETLAVSASIVLAATPVSAAVFGVVPAYGLLANALVLPLVPLTTALSFLSGVAGAYAGPLASLFAAPTWLLLRAIEAVAHLASVAPGANLSLPGSGKALAAGWYAALLGAAVLVRLLRTRRWRRAEVRGAPAQVSSRPRSGGPVQAMLRGGAVIACAGAAISLAGVSAGAGASSATSIRWLSGTRPALLVQGRNGAHILVYGGAAPGRLVSSAQSALGAGAAAAVLVELHAPADDQDLATFAAEARGVHAAEVLFPAGPGATAERLDGVTLQPVLNAARLPLGGDDVLDLLSSHDSAVLRIALAGLVVVVPAGSTTAAVLQSWGEPARADLVALLQPASFQDRAMLTSLEPQIVVGQLRARESLTLPAIATPARALDLAQTDQLRLAPRGPHVALSFRPR